MRWKTQNAKSPKLGDKRIVEKFLWIPTLLDDEWRWLEKAKIVQVFGITHEPPPGLTGNFESYRWFDLHWSWNYSIQEAQESILRIESGLSPKN